MEITPVASTSASNSEPASLEAAAVHSSATDSRGLGRTVDPDAVRVTRVAPNVQRVLERQALSPRQTDDAPPYLRFSAPATVKGGDTANLAWRADNAQQCEASLGWSGSKPVEGTFETDPLTADATYRLRCTGPEGAVVAQVSVKVIEPGPEPSVTFTAAAPGVVPGGGTDLNWASENARACRAEGAWQGDKALSGQEAVGPLTRDSTFSLSCENADGATATKLVKVQIRVADLTWEQPTEHVDGTPYDDPGGYRVYFGNAERTYGDFINIDDPGAVEYTLELPPGNYFFAVTAYSDANLESDYSGEVSKEIL